MLNRMAKVLLVATALAPVLLTFWFVQFSKNWNPLHGLTYLIIGALLCLICLLVTIYASVKLESAPIKVEQVKAADHETMGFLLLYVLPLAEYAGVSIDWPVVVFLAVLISWVVFTSHSYHFNPVMAIFGFHFYEITASNGISYILISRNDVRNCKNVNRVAQLTEYMVIESRSKEGKS